MSDFREQRLASLRDKLKAREGKPGFKVNVEAIKQQIADLEAGGPYRNTDNGQWASAEHLAQNPETTVRVEPEE